MGNKFSTQMTEIRKKIKNKWLWGKRFIFSKQLTSVLKKLIIL